MTLRVWYALCVTCSGVEQTAGVLSSVRRDCAGDVVSAVAEAVLDAAAGNAVVTVLLGVVLTLDAVDCEDAV